MCVCVCVCVCVHAFVAVYRNFKSLTLKVDVFAFGMTIYELITMKPPYNEFPRKNPANLHKYVRDGRRPSLTDKVINKIYLKYIASTWPYYRICVKCSYF